MYIQVKMQPECKIPRFVTKYRMAHFAIHCTCRGLEGDGARQLVTCTMKLENVRLGQCNVHAQECPVEAT